MSNFLDDLEKLEKQESGGGGIICYFNLATGYKIFVSGLSNPASFFPFDAASDDSRAKALEAAKKANAEHGGERRPNAAVQFTLRKATVKGKEVTWKDDRVFVYPLWTDAYKKVVKSAISELGLKPGDYWGRITFTEDPSGRKKTNQQGEEVVELVAYPAELYANEGEAAQAVGESASSTTNGKYPPGWDEKTWTGALPDMRKAKAKGKTAAQIAADYAVPEQYVAAALAE